MTYAFQETGIRGLTIRPTPESAGHDLTAKQRNSGRLQGGERGAADRLRGSPSRAPRLRDNSVVLPSFASTFCPEPFAAMLPGSHDWEVSSAAAGPATRIECRPSLKHAFLTACAISSSNPPLARHGWLNVFGRVRQLLRERTPYREDDDPRGIGCIRWSDDAMQWFVKRMKWWKKCGIWYGTWTWSVCDHHEPEDGSQFWEDDTWIDEGALERAIAAGAGSRIPQEIFLDIATHIIQLLDTSRYSYCSRSALLAVLIPLSMVCRAWRKLIWAKLRTSELTLHSSDIEILQESLRNAAHQDFGTSFTEYLTIKGPQSFTAWAKVAKLLGRDHQLPYLCLTAGTYCPSYLEQTLLSSSYLGSLSNVVLIDIHFTSTRDLHHLLSCFRQLERADLRGVTCGKIVPRVRRVEDSWLSKVHIDTMDDRFVEPWAAMLALHWSWPGSWMHLQYSQVLIAVNIIRCIKWRTNLELTILPVSGEGSVSRTFGTRKSNSEEPEATTVFVELEFHSDAVTANREDAVNIVCVVIRLDVTSSRPSHILRGGWDDMDVIDWNLSCLPHLDTVILETTELRDSAEFASGLVRMANKVRRRTCAEAQQLALQVGETHEALLPGTQAAVSLLWHQETAVDRYDHDYWLDREEQLKCHNKDGRAHSERVRRRLDITNLVT